MCGIAGILGDGWQREQLEVMVASQRHRGPDGEGLYLDPCGRAGLGHNRLSIIDLSIAGRQPMTDPLGRYWISFNGEIYNYLELRDELSAAHEFRTRTDSEVLLAAYIKWGEKCLDRLIGMFAFAIWDEKSKSLFAARDRFGVKPFYYGARPDGAFLFASEIKALHAGGLQAIPDATAWATYLAQGVHDHTERTFWEGVQALPAGSLLKWRDGQSQVSRWYDLAERVGTSFDVRSVAEVQEEYLALLVDSVRLRFRSDVPVGINLSGGLDSSTLLALVHSVQGGDSDVKAFTFCTGDPQYDEIPWVRQMLERTRHELVVCGLTVDEVPVLAESVQRHQDEPFGGIPSLAYARLFERAREHGVIVLLDGQGMDEQWAGYDYYVHPTNGGSAASLVQGTLSSPVRADCLVPEFGLLSDRFEPPAVFGGDRLRNLQYRDTRYTKIPRALRFNDRVSMRSSTELREPFLDHRLFELALAQQPERKISKGTRKWLLRKITRELLPAGVVEAPKRPLQTPQREWLRGPLRSWAHDYIELGLKRRAGDWLDTKKVRAAWAEYNNGGGDNSFYVWQWISVGLAAAS
jgi:asparagine synthase (glutamine-hydrolysing)